MCCSIPITFISGVEQISIVYKGVNITGFDICWIRDGQYLTFQSIYFGFSVTVTSVNIVVIFVLYVLIAIVIHRRQRPTIMSKHVDTSSTLSSPNSILVSTDTAATESKPIEKNECQARRMGPTVLQPIGKDEPAKFKVSSPSTKFNAMFITIAIVYVLSYIPTGMMVIFVLNKNPITLLDLPDWQLQAYSILAQTYVVNNIANPFIYGYFDMQFRKYLARHCVLFFFCFRKL